MIDRRTLLMSGVAAAAALSVPTLSLAQSWPAKPIRFVVPFAAGGGTDTFARILAEEVSKVLGTSVVVENKPGMAGSLGVDYAVKAPADGYTYVLCTPGAQITNPFLYADLPYDPVADIAPVIHMARIPNILVVHPSLGVSTVPELIEYAKASGKALKFSTTGPGSSSRLAAELFASLAEIDVTPVAYPGSGPAAIDLIAGRVDATIDSYTAMMPHVREGKLVILGMSTSEREATDPDVPTIAETLPGYEASTLLYLATASGVAQEIIARMNEVINGTLADEAVLGRMRSLGLTATGGTPEELVAYVEQERQKWGAIIERAGIRLE